MQQGTRCGPYRSRLRYDSEFFLELQLCAEFGISHSTFLDWEPEDRAKAKAYAIEKSFRCTMCGTADWEWDEAHGGNRRAYEPVEKFCPGCHIKAAAAPKDPNRNTDGITIELARTDDIDHARRLMRAEKREREARDLRREERP